MGAQTVLTVAGQNRGTRMQPLKDDRFLAYIALSPAVHSMNDLDGQFGSITAPFLTITGSQDVLGFQADITPENRMIPYEHMPPGSKYLLFLDNGAHLSFAGEDIQRERDSNKAAEKGQGAVPPDDNHIRSVVRATTTAFWLAYLEPSSPQGQDARKWLDADGPKPLFVTGDRWESR
jgi:hypothetical protein